MSGTKISIGHKVKLLLARSILNPPPILLLDEFLSSVPDPDHMNLLSLIGKLTSTIVMVPTTSAEIKLSSKQWQICDGLLSPLSQRCLDEFKSAYSL